MCEFSDKKVLISGGGSGIGRYSAIAFAEKGAQVCVLGRRESKLQETLDQMSTDNSTHCFEVCDVSDIDAVDAAVKRIKDQMGMPDILVNAAGISGKLDVGYPDANFEIWHREIDINLTGSAYLCNAVIPAMVEQSWGRIINVASVNAIIASKSLARHAYNASKAGVCGLTRGVSATYASKGVTVNALCPGLFETEMTQEFIQNSFALSTFHRQIPAARPGNPDEISGPILFLASKAAGYITGQCIAVDGGMSTGSFM